MEQDSIYRMMLGRSMALSLDSTPGLMDCTLLSDVIQRIHSGYNGNFEPKSTVKERVGGNDFNFATL